MTEKRTIIARVLSGRSNAYLIKSGKYFCLVDTGRKGSFRRLKVNLARWGLLPGMKLTLVLTHTHFDHAENAAALQELYDTTIICHKTEAEFLARGDSPLPGGTVFLTRCIMNHSRDDLQPRFRYAPAVPDRSISLAENIEESEVILSLLPVPGHSVGSLAVVVDNEIALAGDALFGILPRSILPPFGDDLHEMKKSWQKLYETRCRLFLPGHGRAVVRYRIARALNLQSKEGK